jgi:hypothetical protein
LRHNEFKICSNEYDTVLILFELLL